MYSYSHLKVSIVAEKINVSLFTRVRNICCGHKIVFDFFFFFRNSVSATNVPRFAQNGNKTFVLCPARFLTDEITSNNVSATVSSFFMAFKTHASVSQSFHTKTIEKGVVFSHIQKNLWVLKTKTVHFAQASPLFKCLRTWSFINAFEYFSVEDKHNEFKSLRFKTRTLLL